VAHSKFAAGFAVAFFALKSPFDLPNRTISFQPPAALALASTTPPDQSIFAKRTRWLTVVIPAYKEEARLAQTVRDIVSHLRSINAMDKEKSFEVIIVDDGSPDGTAEIAKGLSVSQGEDVVRVYRLDPNGGKGCAIRAV
jgi:cellulose synthase/poly-beta-1,6-N-acetylglucosamine synthase-like glycosyltransferase